jgi:hypothetical protein
MIFYITFQPNGVRTDATSLFVFPVERASDLPCIITDIISESKSSELEVPFFVPLEVEQPTNVALED